MAVKLQGRSSRQEREGVPEVLRWKHQTYSQCYYAGHRYQQHIVVL